MGGEKYNKQKLKNNDEIYKIQPGIYSLSFSWTIHIYLSLQQYQHVLGFISAFLSATSVERTRGQTMIGKCNLTAFFGGGVKCQRDMIMALKDNANCRSVPYLISNVKNYIPIN